MAVYPAYFTLLGLIVYAIAYFVYARWYDKHIWEPDPKKTTPAHMYMDGVEFFPASRYILYGFQFKGIAGAAPIVGPFVALSYGWVPALIWILLGNFFIGWIHDYGALFTSVRREGKTLGPLAYEIIGPRARSALMGFLIYYLIMVAAAFFFVCSILFHLRGGGLVFMVFIVIAGIISGVLLYRVKVHILYATIVGWIIMIIGLYLGSYVAPLPKVISPEIAMLATAIICFFGAVLPIIWYAQPVNYMAFYPCIVGIIVLIVGALITPFTGITVVPPAFGPAFPYSPKVGPIWPILMVSIACGAISGWHTLVGTSGSSRQVDVETDILPVGAGSMLTEGLLALSALGAYMAMTSEEAIKAGKFWGFALGASRLAAPLFLTTAENPALQTFFFAFIAIYAITVLQLVFRFMRMAMAELAAPIPPLRVTLGNKYIGTIVGMLISGLFAWSGAWINLWTYFGGSNQLLAGMSLLLVSCHLASVKKPTKFNLAPAIFMLVTCEGALAWENYVMAKAIMAGKPIAKGLITKYPAAALGLNGIFLILGVIMMILGLIVAYDGLKAWAKYRKVAE